MLFRVAWDHPSSTSLAYGLDEEKYQRWSLM
jgi:hypothetical protein